MTLALHDALEAVYDEFRAPTPTRIDGCPCCVDRKTVTALHSRRLRELTEDDLRAYAFSVFLTVGDVADFRYFLPRIFELAIARPDSRPAWKSCSASWRWPDGPHGPGASKRRCDA